MSLIGLYIHIPFCIKKCNYCNFISISNQSIVPDYLNALTREIHLKSRYGYQVDTIYFGGGTPSILNGEDFLRICKAILTHWQIQKNAEITIEVNPGTITIDKIHTWKMLGINRINLGAQSFHDRHLQQLGRIHHAKEVDQAIHWFKGAGFENIGLDLMYGIPGQTQKEWTNDLLQAMSYHPQHLSCYALTYESGTPLYQQLKKKQISSLPERTVRHMMNTLFQIMAEHQYDHYEISNFSSDIQFRSQHNQKYWQGKPYIGLGAASHSFVDNKRFWNCSTVSAYIKAMRNGYNPVENHETLTIEQQMIESIFLGLRHKEGINIYEFDTRFPFRFKDLFSDVLNELEQEGYLEVSTSACRLNDKGKFYLDSICQRLVNIL